MVRLPGREGTTLFTRYVPASTGTHCRKLTSHRGVIACIIGTVLVTVASWRACCSFNVWRTSAFSAMQFAPEIGEVESVTFVWSRATRPRLLILTQEIRGQTGAITRLMMHVLRL